MEVKRAILERRSVRSFRDQPIQRPVLEEILEAAIWAPTAGNVQPWAFICVTDPGIIRQVRAVSPGMFCDPPALICVCTDRRKASRYRLGELLSLFDCAMAAQNIQLRAFDLGLGSCAIRSASMAALGRILETPEHINPQLLIILGYPEAVPQPPPRSRSAVSWEKYSPEKDF